LAGWIKRELRLGHKAEVIRMAAILNPCENFDHSRKVIAESCTQVWVWADENVTEVTPEGSGRATVGPNPTAYLDVVAGVPGFSNEMGTVGWLTIRDPSIGLIEFPNYDRHNGENAKVRARRAILQRKRRSEAVLKPPNGFKTASREEKRRVSHPRVPPLRWTSQSGWSGVDGVRKRWECAFTEVDIDTELAGANAWLLANPRRKYRDWEAFVRNWLKRAQSSHPPRTRRTANEAEALLAGGDDAGD
jgi:hypothetical protein